MDIFEMFVGGEGVRKVVDADEAQAKIDELKGRLSDAETMSGTEQAEIDRKDILLAEYLDIFMKKDGVILEHQAEKEELVDMLVRAEACIKSLCSEYWAEQKVTPEITALIAKYRGGE